ncbi:hypothetical protein HPB51_027995 [Rhipicephalus microplus]|uniref:Uncharacterized protein n=1 Tax=Rhipicephalus microplus TaxID=6941 RepID=A0A9J6CY72_RHIMP|nr:hypothetical protein HPB51_027995 [Rhipicephalus microplus]
MLLSIGFLDVVTLSSFFSRSDGSVRGEGSAIAWKQIEWNLMNVPCERDRQSVENKAARFFRSCRGLVSVVTINVKDHAEVLFSLIPVVRVNAILQLNRSEEHLELISVVSLKYGMSALLSFTSGPNEKLYVVGVRPPLSTYLNDIDSRLVLAKTVGILQLEYAVAAQFSARIVQRLIEIDHDLLLNHGTPTLHKKEALSNTVVPNATYNQTNPEQRTQHQGTVATRRTSFMQSPRNGEAYSAYEEDGSSSFLETKRNSSGSSADEIINTFLPPQKYVVQVGDLGTLRNTLHAIFGDMNTSESAVYVLAYLLLPEDLLMVYANRSDRSVCYKLLRFAFWDVWGFLATRTNLAVSHTRDALFITEAVLTTLKKIAVHWYGNHQSSTSVTQDKIEKLLTLVSSDTGVVYPRWMDGLESMSVRSLYRNIIELGKFRKTQAPDGNVSMTSDGSVKQGQSMKFHIPVEDLAPPSYCKGPLRFLNYATFGIFVALEALKSLGLSFSEAHSLAKTPASINQGVQPVMFCFGAEITLLHWPELEGGSKHEREILLVDVNFWATSFRIALEASELEQARTPREIVEPVMLQTFYARYCSHLCERGEDPFFRHDDARWGNLKCNIAVMNVPQFAPLFQCKRDQVLFKTEFCSVF